MADVKAVTTDVSFEVILNGTFSVDTFLLLSGFLTTFITLKDIQKWKLTTLCGFYLHRYLRLTPVYAMVIALLVGPFYLMGSGPLWQNMYRVQQNCRKNWWMNLLYINNLSDTSEMCLDVSWYLSIEMQYFLIMPLICWLLIKRSIWGVCVIGILFLITTVTPALYIHFHDIPGFSNLAILFDGLSLKALDYQANVYIKPYCRMGPYLVGVFLGYYLHNKGLEVEMHRWLCSFWWIISAVLGLTLIYGTHPYFSGAQVMSNALNSVYGALARTAWSVCVAWVVFACVTGNGGIANTLLSWSVLTPLARVSYCAYLLHIYVLFLFYNTQQVVYYFQQYFMVVIYCGFVVLVMGVSLVFTLAFESPMLEITTFMLPKSLRKERSAPLSASNYSIMTSPKHMQEVGRDLAQIVNPEPVSPYPMPLIPVS